ncbi:MAG: DNA methylase [Clostridia bacterium]|nr:DNA methylase [Clostridia bacterium]
MKNDEQRTYIAIDLKSFYASVECVERGLNAVTTNLVVADRSRTEKTICLAVSPALKSYGIPGRARLFEVIQKVKEVNIERKRKLLNPVFKGSSYDAIELKNKPDYELDFIAAPPRMALYMKYSTNIYNIYLKYFSSEDIVVYSVDEIFCDVTNYLKYYNMSARELVTKVIQDVYNTTGITATAGIGTNLYLCKIAMDIWAKHVEPDEYGVRIAELDEASYRKNLWSHRPITDFWRVGRGYAKRLESHGIYTMGDVAKTSVTNEDLLYNLFGINAELLIDHSWGWEPVTIEDIKAYRPSTNSISSGQVLHCPYDSEKARLIVKEMTELLTLDMVSKNVVTNQMVLTVGYDVDNLTNPSIRDIYKGEITIDRYGRKVPKHAHGTANLDHKTSSTKIIIEAVMELYDRIIDDRLLVRRINITANNVTSASDVQDKKNFEQMNIFTNYQEEDNKKKAKEEKEEAERNIQKAMLGIKLKYGKNAIIKGMNLQEGGTTIQRNNQVGGHRA